MATTPPSDSAIAAWDGGGNNGLDPILVRAFGIAGGYQDYNRILNQIGFDIFQELGLFNSGMMTVVYKVRNEVTARAAQQAALEAVFIDLAGNGELRHWVQVQAPAILAKVPEEDHLRLRPAYEADRHERRVGGLKSDLVNLASLIVLRPEEKQTARNILIRLEELTGYKSVHDALHQLQMSVLVELLRVSGEAIAPVDRQFSIEFQMERTKVEIENINRQFAAPNMSADATNARDMASNLLSKLVNRVQTLDPQAAATAATAARLMRLELRPQMSLFDSLLVSASTQIPFVDFAQQIGNKAIAAPKPAKLGDNPILVENIRSSIEAIAVRLTARQKVHRLWQQVDATIFNVEDLLAGTGSELECAFHWEKLQDLLGQIAANSFDSDVSRLLTIPGLELAESGNGADIRSDGFRSAFNAFSSHARLSFQRADMALLDDCGKLRQLNNPIQALMQ
jgi:hypothetical protein